MKTKNQISPQKIKELLEFTEKSPQVTNLRQQCQEIGEGKRKMISQKVIDDAFDAFGIFVKELSESPEEVQKLQNSAPNFSFVKLSGVMEWRLAIKMKYTIILS